MNSCFFRKWMAACLAVIVSIGVLGSCSKDDEPKVDPVQPETPATPDQPSTSTDQFSNTTWALTSMTGWGKDAYAEYKGMQLRFGSNGSVTEWYSASDSYTGTYTVSGSTITFRSLPFTYEWGDTYPFTVSGNRLTITSGKGTSMATDLIFTKK